MDLPARPQQTPTYRESSRFSNAQIHQEGSHFGATQVRDGSIFQGNFVGLTISERIVPVAVLVLNAHDAQTLQLRPSLTTQGSSRTPHSSQLRRTFRETSCTTRLGRSSAIM
jgi:hypothetical protein